MRPWPGGGFAPAKPVAGGHAEVTLAGKGRGGSNAFLGGALGAKKQQTFVLFTWPGGSASRTVKGNMTIRLVMEWCAAFNVECEKLGNRSASGVAPRSDSREGARTRLASPSTSASSPLVADELRKLAELRDSGVLTQDEFTRQKKRLLG